jgi:hypothetical protein
MNIITLDFETFYDTSFSLSRLTTEEYIRSPDFELIGVGVKVNRDPAYWVSGSRETIFSELKKLPWKQSMLLCHNTMFDGAILNWFCRISPSRYLDTLCMARALHGVDVGGSLKVLAERYEIGKKGEEVIHAKGKRLADFTPEDLARYGEYCINDVELTYKLFSKMGHNFSEQEIDLIDTTIRMFTHPILYVNQDLLQERLAELRKEKLDLLGSLKEKLKCDNEEDVRQKLASNKKFAEVLTELGVKPPMKTSLTTGKETYALAKNDEGFIELTEHDIMGHTQVDGLALTKSTSKTFPQEIKRRRLSRTRWLRPMATQLSTATRLRSKRGCLHGWQGKTTWSQCSPKAVMFTLNLHQKYMSGQLPKPILSSDLLERLAFLGWVTAQEQQNSNTL